MQPKPKPRPKPKPKPKVFDLINDEAICIDGFDDLIPNNPVFVFTNIDTWETEEIENGTWTLADGVTQITTLDGIMVTPS